MDDARFLDIAMEEAQIARREGTSPVGSIIVAPDGVVLSRGRNRVLSGGDQTSHAEVDAIRNAGAAIVPPPAGGGWILYTTAEPCLMCLGAILLCPIDTIVWALNSQMGSAYDALRATAHRSERVQLLRVIREPSPTHRARSLSLIEEFVRRTGR